MVSKLELQEARETSESDCFDCKDWSRGRTVCPAHGIIRREQFNGADNE